MTSNTMAVLKRIEAIIQEGWTKGAYAVDALGCRVRYMDSAACQWCLSGAILKACFEFGVDFEVVEIAFNGTIPGTDNISRFNDRPIRTKEDVIHLIQQVQRDFPVLQFKPRKWTDG